MRPIRENPTKNLNIYAYCTHEIPSFKGKASLTPEFSLHATSSSSKSSPSFLYDSIPLKKQHKKPQVFATYGEIKQSLSSQAAAAALRQAYSTIHRFRLLKPLQQHHHENGSAPS